MISFIVGLLTLPGLLFIAMMVVMMRSADPGHDMTARGINGLACVWAALKHRAKLFRMVTLEDVNGHQLTVNNLSSLYDADGKEYRVRRPYQFLERDWLESMGFRRDDGRVT